MKTSDLKDLALDWAVAKCEPDDTLAIYFDEGTGEPLCRDDWEDNQEYKPSTDWAQGGPIIEREGISTGCHLDGEEWFARSYWGEYEQSGPTPLISAMRCYIASKLGDQVEVPDELQ